MKKILSFYLILFTLNTGIMAQKGFEVNREITINVPADQLWEMVGPGFIEVYKWSSSVDHAEGSGAGKFDGAVCDKRYCDVNVKGFSQISERLIKYEEGNMNLAYQVIDGMPGFITKAVNDWTVVPIDANTSKLVMKAQFESKGFMGFMTRGMMKKKMGKTLTTVLNDAKVYAETGKVSIAKAKRIEKLSKSKAKAAA